MASLKIFDILEKNKARLPAFFPGAVIVGRELGAPDCFPPFILPPTIVVLTEWDWPAREDGVKSWQAPADYYMNRGVDVVVICTNGGFKLDDRRDVLRFLKTERGVKMRKGESEALLALRDSEFWKHIETALKNNEFRDVPTDLVDAFKDYGLFYIFASLFSDLQETCRLFDPIARSYKIILMRLWTMMLKTQEAETIQAAPGYLKILRKNRRHIGTFKRALFNYLNSDMDEAAFRSLLAECATRNRPLKPYGSLQDTIEWMQEPWFEDILTAKRNGWLNTHEQLEERLAKRSRSGTEPVRLTSFDTEIPPWNPDPIS